MLEDPPRFECSDNTNKYRKKFKKKKFFKTNKNIIGKINIRRNSSKGINSKENLKPNHSKSVNAGYAMKKGIMQINTLKRKK